MDEKLINAKINILIEQRNAALNQVVNITADLALMSERVRELEAKHAQAPGVEDASDA